MKKIAIIYFNKIDGTRLMNIVDDTKENRIFIKCYRKDELNVCKITRVINLDKIQLYL